MGGGGCGANSIDNKLAWIFFRPPFLSAIFKPPRRKPGYSPDPASLVSDSGTKVAPLLGSGNRGRDILSVSSRNVSAALFLLNKVCNSIYSNKMYTYTSLQAQSRQGPYTERTGSAI